jgi:hypothetical protein
MTKLQRRQAPDAYDRDLSVKHKDNPEVSLPFNQIKDLSFRIFKRSFASLTLKISSS